MKEPCCAICKAGSINCAGNGWYRCLVTASRELFISYSHKDIKDENWLDRLKVHLASLSQRGLLNVWDDTRITAGKDWQAEITAAMDGAAAAILLVGPGFLGSDFIRRKEPPTLLAAAATREVKIYPLVIGYCQYKKTPSPLKDCQAFNDPEHPLEALSKPEQNRILHNLGGAVDLEVLPTAPQHSSQEQPTSATWQYERTKEYDRTKGYMLVHVNRPSTVKGQKFNIFIFLVQHRTGSKGPPQRTFIDIKMAEFFFGKSWGNAVFSVENTGGLIGVRTEAYGTFLAACRITFASPEPPIILPVPRNFLTPCSSSSFWTATTDGWSTPL
jgi:hypothetical protein